MPKNPLTTRIVFSPIIHFSIPRFMEMFHAQSLSVWPPLQPNPFAAMVVWGHLLAAPFAL